MIDDKQRGVEPLIDTLNRMAVTTLKWYAGGFLVGVILACLWVLARRLLG